MVQNSQNGPIQSNIIQNNLNWSKKIQNGPTIVQTVPLWSKLIVNNFYKIPAVGVTAVGATAVTNDLRF